MFFRKKERTVFLPAAEREGRVRRRDGAFATVRAAEYRLSRAAQRRAEERREKAGEALFAIVRFAMRRMPADRADARSSGGIRTRRARVEEGVRPCGHASAADPLDEAISLLSRLRGLNREERGE